MYRGPGRSTSPYRRTAGMLCVAPEDGNTFLILMAHILQPFDVAKAPMRAKSCVASVSP